MWQYGCVFVLYLAKNKLFVLLPLPYLPTDILFSSHLLTFQKEYIFEVFILNFLCSIYLGSSPQLIILLKQELQQQQQQQCFFIPMVRYGPKPSNDGKQQPLLCSVITSSHILSSLANERINKHTHAHTHTRLTHLTVIAQS